MKAVSLSPPPDVYEDKPASRRVFLSVLRGVRDFAVIQTCQAHPAHTGYMIHAGESREHVTASRIGQRFEVLAYSLNLY